MACAMKHLAELALLFANVIVTLWIRLFVYV